MFLPTSPTVEMPPDRAIRIDIERGRTLFHRAACRFSRNCRQVDIGIGDFATTCVRLEIVWRYYRPVKLSFVVGPLFLLADMGTPA